MRIELTANQVLTNRAVFGWCIRRARHAIALRDYIQAVRWCQLAAETAGFGCGLLASQDLESILLDIAKQISIPLERSQTDSRKRRLHVMTRTDSIGGHNALIKRWIESNPEHEQHSIVVLEYKDPDEASLHKLTEATGGQVYYFGDIYSRPLECARMLRELAWSSADYVVLHHHMHDVIPTIAFGIPSGPPVYLMNMADHLFWTGASVADCVLQLRPESITLSEQHRGIDRNHLFNIPLPANTITDDAQSSTDLRQGLGIPAGAVVFLTIGRATKYEPREGIDFISSAVDVLTQVPDAYLIAVGPSLELPGWQKAYNKMQGRLIPVGNQVNLRPYHMAANIYLEGFPFGSLTALLEAGLAGLPCVRAPGVLPAIFRSTGPAIDNLPVPVDTVAYVKQAVHLSKLSRSNLSRMGSALAAKVDQFHRSGWAQQLSGIQIPGEHRNYSLSTGTAPLSLTEAKMLRWMDGDALKFIRWRAFKLGIERSFDLELFTQSLSQLPSIEFLSSLLGMTLRTSTPRPRTTFIS